MSYNRFSQPLPVVNPYRRQSQYVEQAFVPTKPALPLKELGDYFASQQKQFDDAIAETKKQRLAIQDFGSRAGTTYGGDIVPLKIYDNVKAINDSYRQRFDKALEGLKSGRLDIRSEVERLAADYASNENLKTFKYNTLQIEEQEKAREDMKATGSQQYIFNAANDNMYKFASEDLYDANGKARIFNAVKPSNPLDHDKIVAGLMSGLTKSSIPIGTDKDGKPVLSQLIQERTPAGTTYMRVTAKGITEQQIAQIFEYAKNGAGEYSDWANSKATEYVNNIKYSGNTKAIPPDAYIKNEKGEPVSIDWKKVKDFYLDAIVAQDINVEGAARKNIELDEKVINTKGIYDDEDQAMKRANFKMGAQKHEADMQAGEIKKLKDLADIKLTVSQFASAKSNPTSIITKDYLGVTESGNQTIGGDNVHKDAWFKAVKADKEVLNSALKAVTDNSAELVKALPADVKAYLKANGINEANFIAALAKEKLSNPDMFNRTFLANHTNALTNILGTRNYTAREIGELNLSKEGRAATSKYAQANVIVENASKALDAPIREVAAKGTPMVQGKNIEFGIPTEPTGIYGQLTQNIQSLTSMKVDVGGSVGNPFMAYDAGKKAENKKATIGDGFYDWVSGTMIEGNVIDDTDIDLYNQTPATDKKIVKMAIDANGNPYYLAQFTVHKGSGNPAETKFIRLKPNEGNNMFLTHMRQLKAIQQANVENINDNERIYGAGTLGAVKTAAITELNNTDEALAMAENMPTYKHLATIQAQDKPQAYTQVINGVTIRGQVVPMGNNQFATTVDFGTDAEGRNVEFSPADYARNHAIINRKDKSGTVDLSVLNGYTSTAAHLILTPDFTITGDVDEGDGKVYPNMYLRRQDENARVEKLNQDYKNKVDKEYNAAIVELGKKGDIIVGNFRIKAQYDGYYYADLKTSNYLQRLDGKAQLEELIKSQIKWKKKL